MKNRLNCDQSYSTPWQTFLTVNWKNQNGEFWVLSFYLLLKENTTIGEKQIKKEYTNELLNPWELEWSSEELSGVVAKINGTNENRQMQINLILTKQF